MTIKKLKFKNIPIKVAGILFPSKKEAGRYLELLNLEKFGHIHNLELQTKFPIEIKGQKVFTYKADFTYFTEKGDFVIEDVKGVKTPIYRLKKKCVEAFYGHSIVEI